MTFYQEILQSLTSERSELNKRNGALELAAKKIEGAIVEYLGVPPERISYKLDDSAQNDPKAVRRMMEISVGFFDVNGQSLWACPVSIVLIHKGDHVQAELNDGTGPYPVIDDPEAMNNIAYLVKRLISDHVSVRR